MAVSTCFPYFSSHLPPQISFLALVTSSVSLYCPTYPASLSFNQKTREEKIIFYYDPYGCNLGRLVRSKLNPTRCFGHAWAIIFNTRIGLKLDFFKPSSICVGHKQRFEQPEPNMNPNIIIYNIHFF